MSGGIGKMKFAVELIDTLDWNVTSDEGPDELEYTLAYLDDE